MDGLICVDKPVGMTSHDVVNYARRVFGIKKIGHTGTLDPFASGLLLLCIGKGARIAEYLFDDDKEYEAVIRLGESTDTFDLTGKIVEKKDISSIDEVELKIVLERFKGEIEQIPPMYSALKRNGVPLYKLARRGEDVERSPRKVYFHEIDLLSIIHPDIKVRVSCSKGTYIRSLAHDIGQGMGTGGHLTSLKRTRAGRFTLKSAVSLDELGTTKLTPLKVLLDFMPHIMVTGEGRKKLVNGAGITAEMILKFDTSIDISNMITVIDENEDLIGVGKFTDENPSVFENDVEKKAGFASNFKIKKVFVDV